jgi:hypothetical protein
MAAENKFNPMPQKVEAVLREAVKDLLYMSESDEPFEVVLWKGRADCSDPRDLLGRAKAGTAAPIEAVSLDDFFKNLIKEEKWHGQEEKALVQKYRKLKATVAEHLSNVQVFRVGTIQVDIFIVGKTKQGDWAGVKTLAVET